MLSLNALASLAAAFTLAAAVKTPPKPKWTDPLKAGAASASAAASAAGNLPDDALPKWIHPVGKPPGAGYSPHPSVSGSTPWDYAVPTGTPVKVTNHGKVKTIWRNPDPAPWNTLKLGADEKHPQLGTYLAKMTDKRGAVMGGFGNHVIVEHVTKDAKGKPKSVLTAYCHLSRIDVKEGQVLKQGELIGLSGGDKGTRKPKFEKDPKNPGKWIRTGYTYFKPFGPDGTNSGAHLHYEGPKP